MNRPSIAASPIGGVIAVLGQLVASAALAFTFQPAGVLTAGSGTGLKTAKVYAPGIRYPIEKAPSFLNSQVWGVGGSQGPKGGQCDAKNFSYPWWDNYCETRTWSMPLCPSGKGHQGQDIRASTCANKTWWAVATEAGTITSIGTYSVYLKGGSGTLFRYLHMDPGTLAVKVGQKVSKGQKLGLVSNAFGGTPTSMHLHFDVEQYVAGVGTVFVSPYNSLVEGYKALVSPTDPCANKSCDDGKVCTADTCSAGNCNHAPISGNCDDGNPCTLQDSCSGGQCQPGLPKPCDDGNLCTADSCSGGSCVFTAHSQPCDDGDPCTVADTCGQGKCQPGTQKPCSDGIACTEDSCIGGTCKHAPKAGTCDDGDPCTADTCDASGCKHVKDDCSDDNPCTTDSCVAATCTHAPKSGACDDGSACTIADSCSAGQCVGAAKQCEDENPCTLDACVAGACTYKPVSAQCDDGNGCTEGDYCALGKCIAGAPAACDDGLDCTVDSCADGKCQHSGQVQAESRKCAGPTIVEVYDACGAGPQLVECPESQPCGSGACGGPPDSEADAAGSVGAESTETTAIPAPSANAVAPSGCQGGPSGWASAVWALGAALALLRLRRKGPGQ